MRCMHCGTRCAAAEFDLDSCPSLEPLTELSKTDAYDPTIVDWRSVKKSFEYIAGREPRFCNFAIRVRCCACLSPSALRSPYTCAAACSPALLPPSRTASRMNACSETRHCTGLPHAQAGLAAAIAIAGALHQALTPSVGGGQVHTDMLRTNQAPLLCCRLLP
jgi:hypothetical protein